MMNSDDTHAITRLDAALNVSEYTGRMTIQGE